MSRERSLVSVVKKLHMSVSSHEEYRVVAESGI